MSVPSECVASNSKTWKSLLRNVIRLPGKFFAWNKSFLFDYLDPFETETTKVKNETSRSGTKNWSMLFPDLIILLVILVGTLYLEYIAKGRIEMRSLPSSPTIFIRQILPPGVVSFLKGDQ